MFRQTVNEYGRLSVLEKLEGVVCRFGFSGVGIVFSKSTGALGMDTMVALIRTVSGVCGRGTIPILLWV